MHLITLRTALDDRTIGRLFIDGKLFGYTLEDPLRPDGVKIQGKSCIPNHTYFVGLSHSPKFGRVMPIIYNVKADQSVNVLGVKFTGIRAHDGTGPGHTEGCPLLGHGLTSAASLMCNKEYLKLIELLQQEAAAGNQVLWTFANDVEPLNYPVQL